MHQAIIRPGSRHLSLFVYIKSVPFLYRIIIKALLLVADAGFSCSDTVSPLSCQVPPPQAKYTPFQSGHRSPETVTFLTLSNRPDRFSNSAAVPFMQGECQGQLTIVHAGSNRDGISSSQGVSFIDRGAPI
ncbi:hypothetical protein [Absidia glauca]|uniref:Uncharacterized protein n=1 Tax=Absidia glauca TaxID=4829 RepID=A0A168T234_ABSGL|nr:hypothetical protein [Absidia glauca]